MLRFQHRGHIPLDQVDSFEGAIHDFEIDDPAMLVLLDPIDSVDQDAVGLDGVNTAPTRIERNN
ncbi:hypothetical protein soil367_05175 [Hydrocarboniclastica marina]|uniref:Uncharacterized protein n=1 Tax=Hydrocarboniclastica marina TaxID=2259620 RepID=A0A4V1D8J1_9ALTE|nr:hypothetical protein soil367_05175 [Hydrocarboniclastica marina]